MVLNHFNYKEKHETESRYFFFCDFSMVTAWYVTMLVASEIHPFKQEFCGEKNKDISILTKIHINHDQIHDKRNNWLSPIFFSPADSHTKWLLVLIHLGLQGITVVDTDPKVRFVSFKVILSNDRVPWFMPLQDIAAENSWQGVFL